MTVDDPLALDAETMRELGYRTVDMMVDLLADPRSSPALRTATRAEMTRRLSAPPPLDGEPFEGLLGRLREDVLPFTSRFDHPAYFAYIPACGTWPGALGDLVASAWNIYAGHWVEAAGPNQLELEVLGWFRSWIGYPDTAEGVLVSGGSAANMTALACARESRVGPMRDDLVAYCSDQSHSSVARAARTLGFRPQQLRVIPTDRDLRMRPDLLAAAMDRDLEAGRLPLFVSASAGATNTGVVDPLGDLAELCGERGVWLHVDAAYGGFAALTERGRSALVGIELADSVTLDPHKWLYQPFECGAVLVREGHRLEDAFRIEPEYLKDDQHGDGVDFADRGLQLSRSARALKVWLSVRYFGVDAFRTAIDRCLDLALHAEEIVRATEELELLQPASLGIVCFRRRPAGVYDEVELDTLNAELVERLAASGLALVSSTRLHGRYAVRLCVLNHTSTAADVEQVLDWFATADVDGSPAGHVDLGCRHLDVTEVWSADRVGHDVLSAVPLFRHVDAAGLDAVIGSCVLVDAAPGETIIAEGELSSDFYVLLAGAVEVSVRGEVVNVLRAGDFFGELAALDWGADYHYPRLASITVRERSRLLRLPGAVLNELRRNDARIEASLNLALADRMPRT